MSILIVEKVELDLSNYATKADLKETTGVVTLNLAASATLKAEADKMDIDKLKTVPADLIKVRNVVSNDVKITVYDKFVTKVNSIKVSSTKGWDTKTQHESGKQGFEKKIEGINKSIPNTSELVKTNWVQD